MMMYSEWPDWLINIVQPANRWLHIVASTLIVGGVLFFEMVLPRATSDLRDEQQLAVFGRARWVFRRVFVLSMLLLIFTGIISSWQMWALYQSDEITAGGFWEGSRAWLAGHVALAIAATWIGLRVTYTKRLLPRPVGWLRALLVILLIGIFTASVARHVRLRIDYMRKFPGSNHGSSAV